MRLLEKGIKSIRSFVARYRFTGVVVASVLITLANESSTFSQVGESVTAPRSGTVVLRAREMWRVGSNDDVIIGLPYDVAVGSDKNIYVLDIKMLDIKVLSPEGELVRTIGREGEGPGEFTSPSSLIFLSNDVVGVTQARPGRIVGLYLDGRSASNVKPLVRGSQNETVVIMRALADGGNLVIVGFDTAVKADDRSVKRRNFVRRYGLDGQPLNDYVTKESTFKFDEGATVRERDLVFPRENVAVDANGRVYVGLWERYEINVYAPDGKLERTLQRPFEPWKRGGLARSVARFQMAVQLWGLPNIEFELEEFESAVLRVRCARDGTCWVQSGRDVYERREGVFAGWDVFSADGAWMRHIEIEAPGSPALDAMILTDEGCALVVTNFLDQVNVLAGLPSYAKQMGRDGQGLELICYRLEPK